MAKDDTEILVSEWYKFTICNVVERLFLNMTCTSQKEEENLQNNFHHWIGKQMSKKILKFL